jgi:hypothetical protein
MWKNLYINTQNIETETEKSVLINMPKKSEYSGFSFWHPRKLVRNAGHKGYRVSIGYTDDFKFNLKRYGKNNNVLQELSLTAKEMELALNNEQLSQDVEEKITHHVHTPEKLSLSNKLEVKNELFDN